MTDALRVGPAAGPAFGPRALHVVPVRDRPPVPAGLAAHLAARPGLLPHTSRSRALANVTGSPMLSRSTSVRPALSGLCRDEAEGPPPQLGGEGHTPMNETRTETICSVRFVSGQQRACRRCGRGGGRG
jgi:hypothetical protein